MPRYYFDIRNCGTDEPDAEGVEYPDLARARVAAIKTLAEAAKFELTDCDEPAYAVSIRDESGRTLLTVEMNVRSSQAAELASA